MRTTRTITPSMSFQWRSPGELSGSRPLGQCVMAHSLLNKLNLNIAVNKTVASSSREFFFLYFLSSLSLFILFPSVSISLVIRSTWTAFFASVFSQGCRTVTVQRMTSYFKTGREKKSKVSSENDLANSQRSVYFRSNIIPY